MTRAGDQPLAGAERDALRAALRDALGDEFVAVVDSHAELLEQHPDHLRALVEVDDPVERMRQARAYVAQLEALDRQSAERTPGLLPPAEAYAAAAARAPLPRPAGFVRTERTGPPDADERSSAQLRLRVEGWLTEAERILRRIDANTLERLQADDRQVIEDQIDRVRSRLLFLVAGRRYPD